MTTVTQENVRFNGTLDNAAVLKTGATKTLILTDDLSVAERSALDAFVAKYGSNPLAGPTAAKGTIVFPSTTIGGTSTGLVSTASPTAGTATINLGGTAVGGNASGLSTAVGTQGSQTVNLAHGVIGATATGLANDATVYTVTMTIDGVSTPVSVVGSAAQTYTTLIAELNTDIGAAGTALLSGGDIKIRSATFGTTSKVRITAGNLFPALTTYQGVFPPADGDSTARTYGAIVVVDGVVKPVNFGGVAGATFTNVISQINTDLGASATAALSGGNIVITSATTGASSSVAVYDSGFLFSSLTGYTRITSAPGTSVRVYTASITVDGVVKPIAIQGSTAQTFTTLIAEINTDLGASATAALSGGSIVVTSATTGASSTVTFTDGDLFRSVAGFSGFTTQGGATDLVAEMKKVRVGGATLFDAFKVIVVGSKPALPAVPAALPKTLAYTYFNGTVWKYLVDDTNV